MYFVGFMASIRGEKCGKPFILGLKMGFFFLCILATFPALFQIDFIENGLKRQTKGSRSIYFLFHVNSFIFYQDMFDFVEVVNSLELCIF